MTVTPPGSRPGRFHTTRWSLVMAAGAGTDEHARSALEQLAHSYWYPLYSYLRRRGCDREEAHDVTQGFFAHLLERDAFRHIGPDGGRFRSYLLTGVKNYLLNERARASAEKRGGGRPVISMDARQADRSYLAEPSHQATPEAAFERSWARSVLERALDRLETTFDDAGKAERYEALKEYFLGSAADFPTLAQQLGISEGAVRVALHRLRQQFATCLRQEVQETVADPSEVEDELRHLLDALAH